VTAGILSFTCPRQRHAAPCPLDDAVRQILDGKNFATLATISADGSPHTSVVWYLRDGDHVLISTKADRVKARNIEHDPRVALSIYEIENPYSSIDIRGTAELIVDEGKALPEQVSMKYMGTPPPPEPAEDVRYIVRITPEKVTRFSV
jgi:PPOX class probable F420-dependent enzyme